MRYFSVTDEELEAARPGLSLIERLTEDEESFQPFLYGILGKADVLLEAEEILASDAEETTSAISLAEIAIAIPFSDSSLYAMTGQGWPLQGESFSYRLGSDDVRTGWFSIQSGLRPRVTLKDFSTLALSDSDTWLDEFMKEYGSEESTTDSTVKRDEGATADIAEEAPEAEETPAPEPTPEPVPEATPKHSSKKRARTAPISRFPALDSLDKFLG